MAFVRAMYKKGTGNDKQGKDAGNRTFCPNSNYSQAIITFTASATEGKALPKEVQSEIVA